MMESQAELHAQGDTRACMFCKLADTVPSGDIEISLPPGQTPVVK